MSTLVEKWLPTTKRVMAMWGFSPCFGVKKWPFRKYYVPSKGSESVNLAIRRNIPEDQNPQRRTDVEDTPEVGEK